MDTLTPELQTIYDEVEAMCISDSKRLVNAFIAKLEIHCPDKPIFEHRIIASLLAERMLYGDTSKYQF